MKPCTFLAALLFAVLLAPGPPPADAGDEGEWSRPYAAFLPGLEPVDGNGDKTAVSLRLLRQDALGRHVFVPHGLVTYHTEESGPLVRGPRLLACGEGDEFGFVNVLPLDVPREAWESGSHWHFEGPGQGAEHDFRWFRSFDDEEVILPGGVDREILVIGPLGEPLEGARVSMYLGCPHSPTLRSAVTDERGIVRLENLPADRDEDFWVEAPGIRFGPYSLTAPWVGNPATTILTDLARTARGTVIDVDGGPLAGVVVRATGGYPRGPVTATTAEGTFVLHGIESFHEISLYRPESPHAPRPDCIVRDFAEEVPLRVTLRGTHPTSLTNGEPRHTVDVVALYQLAWTEPDGRKVDRWVEGDRIPVVLTRRPDGFTIRGETGDSGFRALVPAGTYLVRAGGGFSRYQEGRVVRTLPAPGGAPVQVKMPGEQPGVVVDRGDYKEKKYVLPDTIEMRIPGRKKDLSDLRQYYGLQAPNGRLGFFLSPPARIVPADDRKVILDAPPRNRIRFRLVDERGESVETDEVRVGWCYIGVAPEKQDDGSYLVHTWACGRTRISFGDPFFDPTSVTVDLPVEEAGLVDLGTVVVRTDEDYEGDRRTVRLLLAGGGTATDEDLGRLAAYIDDGGGEWSDAEMDEQGALTVEDSPDSVRVHVVGPGFYPYVTDLRPDGPDEIRLPSAKITGRLIGADGKLLPGVLYVDVTRFESEDGKFEVRGVPPGPHILIAGAKGHVGEVRRILVQEGETRDLQVHLTPR